MQWWKLIVRRSSILIDPGHWYSKMGRKGWDEAPDVLGLNVGILSLKLLPAKRIERLEEGCKDNADS
jgi:hypothetical protein